MSSLPAGSPLRPMLVWGAIAGVLMLLPMPAIAPLAHWPVLRAELQDSAHPLIFAVLAGLGRSALVGRAGGAPGTRPVIALALGLAMLGASIEIAQGYAGRQGSWHDLGGDLLGIGFGLLWPLRTPAARAWAVLLALAAAAPLLWTLLAYGYRHTQSPLIWRADSPLLNHFARVQQGEYPGLVMREVPHDWRDQRALRITVANHSAQPSEFVVRIHDAAHDQRFEDRFNRRYELGPEQQRTFEIPLEEIQAAPADRKLDLSAVESIVLFQYASPRRPRVMPLRIELVP